MEEKKREIRYRRYDTAAELPEQERRLLKAALAATDRAYAPFSGFRVGAAALLADDSIHTANNQENLAFPSGLCAERTVLFHLGSQGLAGQVRALAIRARSDHRLIELPPTPCGACRQVMVEYERLAGTPFVVLMQGWQGSILRMEGVEACLLPFGFDIRF